VNISIIGSGYVGLVSGACFSELGHNVLCVDKDVDKVEMLKRGEIPIYEPGLEPIVKANYRDGRLSFTENIEEGVAHGAIIFIAVDTPSKSSGEADLSYVEEVSRQIAQHLKEYRIIVEKSTVPVQTGEWVMKTIKETVAEGVEFDVASNPEFLREGTAVEDYFNPPYTLIGAAESRTIGIMKDIYRDIDAEIHVTQVKNAEFIKYVNNSWHAVKVAFANEVGTVCKSMGLDSHEVMKLFFMDKKLNLSSCYLMPGFAFGGSCLPKDLKALNYYAHHNHISTPLISSVMQSNQQHIMNALNLIYESGKKRVGLIGLSFKSGTDDLRESPMLLMAEQLIGKGYELMINDCWITLSQLNGANKTFLHQHVPHIAKLLYADNQLDDIREFSDVLVIGRSDGEIPDKLHPSKNPGKMIIDLVRIDPALTSADNYYGICW